MKLLTKAQHARLLRNGRQQEPIRGSEIEIDFWPVVKLVDRHGAGVWLLTDLDPEDPDIAWGLHDPRFGLPGFDRVRLSELAGIRNLYGPCIRRDRHFKADKPISAYYREAYDSHPIKT